MTTPVILTVVLALATPAEDLDKGKNALSRAEYRRAIEILSSLLEPTPKLESEDEIVQARKMLGVAYLGEKQPDLARQEFVKLLELNPSFRFDPVLDSQQGVEFFNRIVSEQQEALARIKAAREKDAERRKAEDDERRKQSQRVLVERRIEKHSLARALIPFGVGQFQNGQEGKGRALLVSEGALGAISLGAFVMNFALYGLHRRIECKSTVTNTCELDLHEQRTSEALKWTSFGSGVAFWGVAGWGLWDAVRNFREEVHVPPDIERPMPAPTPAATPPRAARSELQPVWMGHAVGVGGRF